jgi:hypothetical protein
LRSTWHRNLRLESIGLFVLGFITTATLLHQLLGDPLRLHADSRSEKVLVLDRNRSTANSAAFGASFVKFGFDPRTFDRSLNGLSLQTRTISLAIEGGTQGEQRAMALEFVQHLPPTHSPDPCLVMLDVDAMANMTVDHLIHPRTINIYDLPTARFISHLTEPSMSLSQRIRRPGLAYLAALVHYANTGMLSNRVFSPPIDQKAFASMTDGDRRGFDALTTDNPHDHSEVVRQIGAWRGNAPLEARSLNQGNLELIAQLQAAAPTHHLSPVYLVMPRLSDLVTTPQYPDSVVVNGERIPIIDLAHPDLYPSIYQTQLWHDDIHVNEEGAQLVTALFAEQLKLWYQQHGAPRSCTA